MKGDYAILQKVIFVVGVIGLLSGIVLALCGNDAAAVCIGFGTGITIVALVQTLQKFIKPDYTKKKEIEARDERLLTIRDKASRNTLIIVMLLTALGVVMSYALRSFLIGDVLAVSLGIQVIIYYLSYLYYRRKI